MPEPTYTVEQVKAWLEYEQENVSDYIADAVDYVDDPQHGISAVTERNKDER